MFQELRVGVSSVRNQGYLLFFFIAVDGASWPHPHTKYNHDIIGRRRRVDSRKADGVFARFFFFNLVCGRADVR